MAFRPAGSHLSDFFGDKPDLGALGAQATAEHAADVANTALNNARTAATVMKAESDKAAADHWADATREIGAVNASSNLTSAVTSGAQSVVGGLLSRGSGAGVDSAGYQIGKARDGSYGGYGGKYGSFENPTESIRSYGASSSFLAS